MLRFRQDVANKTVCLFVYSCLYKRGNKDTLKYETNTVKYKLIRLNVGLHTFRNWATRKYNWVLLVKPAVSTD